MKKLIFILLIIFLLILPACTKTEIAPEDISGKVYLYEGGGISGGFIISLFDDGTFSYSEGTHSSHIGLGGWTLEDNTLTITENSGKTNVFTVREGALVFRESGSDNFKYTKLENGARFYVMTEIGE